MLWGPLSSGYLSGKFRETAPTQPTRLIDAGWMDNVDTTRAVIDVLATIAGERASVSIAQVTLNWVARKPGVASIIVGAQTDEELANNLAAAQ